MAQITSHPDGAFCWLELATSDQNAAKQFYQPLFGWEAAEMPMGPSDIYILWKLEGRDAGGCFSINEEMKSRGVPPHWMPYVQVKSADETAAKAKEAGGSITVEPFDVFDIGRMCVIHDPTGAVFSIWEPRKSKGTSITGVPGTLCWADLSTPDVERATAFYKTIFGWEFTVGEHDTSGYLHIKNGSDFIGGVPPASQRSPHAPPHWLLYFLVDNCDASAAKAKELGAQFYLEPMSMENVGRFAVLADPQKAVLALFQPAPRS